MELDAQFSDDRLAAIYDDVDGPRDDLDHYVSIAEELGAQSVLDVGCGTGSLAVRLSTLGYRVVGVDPAGASIDVAIDKDVRRLVTWVRGVVADVAGSFDLAVMTGNVAQVFLADADWIDTVRAIRARLEIGGWFVFETRDPTARAWETWDTQAPLIHHTVEGRVEFERRVLDVTDGRVTFRADYRFADGSTRRSVSTLRFRDRETIASTLGAAGMRVHDIRDAPDRPGREFVVLSRPDDSG